MFTLLKYQYKLKDKVKFGTTQKEFYSEEAVQNWPRISLYQCPVGTGHTDSLPFSGKVVGTGERWVGTLLPALVNCGASTSLPDLGEPVFVSSGALIFPFLGTNE